jgi:hypothetical protein
MWHDPIVQETRLLRDTFSAQHGHDADAIFEAILLRQSASKRQQVSYAKYHSQSDDSIQFLVAEPNR